MDAAGVCPPRFTGGAVHAQQHVGIGGRRVHPRQLPRGPQPGLVEVRHLGPGDPVGDHRDHLIDDHLGGPGRPGRDRPGRHVRTEQVTQRRRSTPLGQELAVEQVHPDPGQPRPVLHRRVHPGRCGSLGDRPARAFPDDQIVLGHLQRDRLGQVEHLPRLHPDHSRTGQIAAAPGAGVRFVPTPARGVGDRLQRQPGLPFRPARSLPDLARNDLGAGLANPSELGGLLELRDDIPNRASNSAIRSNASARAALNSAFWTTNCSYDGCAVPGSDTRKIRTRLGLEHAQNDATRPSTQAATRSTRVTYPVTIN
jgi:hypothetical protein